jgi:hypothetical protein
MNHRWPRIDGDMMNGANLPTGAMSIDGRGFGLLCQPIATGPSFLQCGINDG